MDNPLTTYGQRPQKKATPCDASAPSTFRSIPKSGVIVGRPYRAHCLSRTKSMALPWAGKPAFSGQNDPVKLKLWDHCLRVNGGNSCVPAARLPVAHSRTCLKSTNPPTRATANEKKTKTIRANAGSTSGWGNWWFAAFKQGGRGRDLHAFGRGLKEGSRGMVTPPESKPGAPGCSTLGVGSEGDGSFLKPPNSTPWKRIGESAFAEFPFDRD
jgi:hypothetical protein